MGRTTKLLNNNIKDNIIKLIKDGNYIKTACVACGITYATYWNWLQRAEHYSPGNGTGGDKIYFDFFEELKTAEEQNIAHNVAVVQKATESNHPNAWYPAAWLLERKRPSEFGKRMELEVGPSKVLLALQEQANELISQRRPFAKSQGNIDTTKLITTVDNTVDDSE